MSGWISIRAAAAAIMVLSPAPAAVAQIPNCPQQAGEIGDWGWVTTFLGPQVVAKRITLVAKGDVGDGQVKFWGRPGEWVFRLEVIRPFRNISMTASNSSATMRWSAVATLQTPLPTSPKHWWWLVNLTQVFDSKAGLAHARDAMTFELREGDRVVTKVAISTKGFNEALAKAEGASRPIVEMYKSNRCKPGADGDED
jgi:hypothetical protein